MDTLLVPSRGISWWCLRASCWIWLLSCSQTALPTSSIRPKQSSSSFWSLQHFSIFCIKTHPLRALPRRFWLRFPHLEAEASIHWLPFRWVFFPSKRTKWSRKSSSQTPALTVGRRCLPLSHSWGRISRTSGSEHPCNWCTWLWHKASCGAWSW